MPSTFRSKDGLLARVNFPLYSLQMLTSRHVLVAGGGGSSKTGVANGFEIFEISHDGNHFVAEEVIRHETGPNVVMNCAIFSSESRTYLVSGQESHCQLYLVETSVCEADNKKENNDTCVRNNLKQRKKTEELKSQQKISSRTKVLTFKIKPSDSIQTDFSPVEPLQKVVRISSKGQLMATAGTDGHVRVWKFPQLKKVFDINAHSREVDDMDFNPKETQLVSLSKDGKAIIWNMLNGKKIHELSWQVPQGTKYLYKRCRFGAIEENKDKSRLFILTNPAAQKGKLEAYLQLWDSSEGTLKKCTSFKENVASLAVRDDGRFVAVGTMFSGSVGIFVAFSLQKVLNVNGAHNMFITGLEFLPVTSDLISVTSNAEAAVISVSVDNRVCIHTLYHRHNQEKLRRQLMCVQRPVTLIFYSFKQLMPGKPDKYDIKIWFDTIVACHNPNNNNIVLHICHVQHNRTLIKQTWKNWFHITTATAVMSAHHSHKHRIQFIVRLPIVTV